MLALLLAGMALYALNAKDWELVSTKHYWSRGFYYSGYALQYLPSWGGFRTIHTEAQANLFNTDPLTNPGPYRWEVQVRGFPGTERLLAPLLAGLVVRASGGSLDLPSAFGLVDFALWCAAVLLMHRLASVFFTDDLSPSIAAAFCAVYPTFTLTVGALKIQQMGVVYLLAAMLLYERRITRAGPVLQFVALLALVWMGLFASGGWAFLCVYVVLRAAWVEGWRAWRTVVLLLAAVLVARWGLSWLTRIYELPSVERDLRNSFGAIVIESLQWLRAAATGGDTSAHKLLNYDGLNFFERFLPIIVEAFLRGHVWLLLAAAAAARRFPQSRMLLLMAVPLFFAGHAGTVLVGWQWHYGYLSAPAGLLLVLAASGGLGAVLQDPHTARRWRIAALAAIALVVVPWLDLKTHAGLYLAGGHRTYQSRVTVHFEGVDAPRVY